MRIVLLGAPGAGKGTQAINVARVRGIVHVASGDLFRYHLSQGTSLGELARGFMGRGELVPDDVTIEMVLERIGRSDAVGGYVLDGFPRTLAQAKALDSALMAGGQNLDAAPIIEVATGELIRRISGRWICRLCQQPYHEQWSAPRIAGICDDDGGELYQRDDDKPDIVRARLEAHDKTIWPLIDYYQTQGKLIRVDGQVDVERVTENLLMAIASVAIV